MLYLPHFLTGAAILKIVPNPAIGIPLAVVSHFVLDLTPHNDFDLRPGITLKDFLAHPTRQRNIVIAALSVDYFFTAIAFVWILSTYHNVWLLVGAVAGVSPDALEQILMVFGRSLPGWQDKLQWRVSAKYGFISYPIVSLLAFYLLTH